MYILFNGQIFQNVMKYISSDEIFVIASGSRTRSTGSGPKSSSEKTQETKR